jgi:predicted HicB family RNase H-like nuclease
VTIRMQLARDGRKQLNVRIPRRLHTRLKLLAVRRGVAMDDLVERAIRYLLRRRRSR